MFDTRLIIICIMNMSFINVIALLTTRGLTSSIPLVAVVVVAVALLVVPTIVVSGSFPLIITIISGTVFVERLRRSPIMVFRAPSWFVIAISSIAEPAVTWRWWSSWLWGSAIPGHFPLAFNEPVLRNDSGEPCCDEAFRGSAPCPWSVAGVVA